MKRKIIIVVLVLVFMSTLSKVEVLLLRFLEHGRLMYLPLVAFELHLMTSSLLDFIRTIKFLRSSISCFHIRRLRMMQAATIFRLNSLLLLRLALLCKLIRKCLLLLLLVACNNRVPWILWVTLESLFILSIHLLMSMLHVSMSKCIHKLNSFSRIYEYALY